MNIRKLFPEKHLTKKGFLEFLDKKGFYIVLILCIAIIGATAVFMSTHDTAPLGNESEAKVNPDSIEKGLEVDYSQEADITKTEESSLTEESSAAISHPASGQKSGIGRVASASSKSPVLAESSKKDAPEKQEKKEDTKKKTAPGEPKADSGSNEKFVMPVFGDITLDYAQDKLVYSKTLEEWRSHSGLDIAADRGAPVKAVNDGVISEIKNDPRYGIMVVVEHDNGLKTVYANLASDEMAAPNQKVKQGDVIGAVGNTAIFEASEQSHLHFEVWKENQPVNPQEYLPEK